MKKSFSRLLAVLMVCVMAFALAACSKKEVTLESWYADNAAEFKEIEDTLNASQTDCKIELKVEGNTLIYAYTYAEALDVSDPEVKKVVTSTFDTYFAAYESTFTDLADQLSEEAKVDNVSVRVDVFNPDGAEVYSTEFSQK